MVFSRSMVPTLEDGDCIVMEMAPYVLGWLKINDIVIFEPPQGAKEVIGNAQFLIKRVVAMAGDTIQIIDGGLYVNGRLQIEPYILECPNYSIQAMPVPLGHVYVLGDNRNESFDSKDWGALPVKSIIGRLMTF